MPAKDWGLASIKQNKNGNMLVRQLIQRLIKGKQPVARTFNQQNKNGNMLVKQLIQRLIKGKQPVVRAFGNPGQKNSPLKGFRIKEAGGGGDCFYRSVMEALGVGSKKFIKLRKSAAENAKKFSEKLNRIRSGLEAPTGSDIALINHLHYQLMSERINNIQISPSKIDNAIAYTNFLIKEIF